MSVHPIRLWAAPLAPLRAALLVFVAAAFLLPSEPAYAVVFYVAVLPLAMLTLRIEWRAATGDPGAMLGVLLILWSALTLIWGRDDGHRSIRFAAGAACTLLFFLATLQAWRNAPACWRQFGTV